MGVGELELEWPRGRSAGKLWLFYLVRHRWKYALGVLALLLTNVCEVLVPKLVQWTLDLLGGKAPPEIFSALARFAPTPHQQVMLGAIIVLALQFIGRAGWRRYLGQRTHYASCSLKADIWNSARFYPMRRLEKDLSPGELINVSAGDVGSARFMFGFSIVGTVDTIFLFLLSFAAMLQIDWQLTLATVALLPLLPKFLDRLARRESAQHKAAQESLSGYTDLVTQAISTVRLQRLTQSAGFWSERLKRAAEDYRGKRLSVLRTSLAFIPWTGLASAACYAVLMLLGVRKVIAGEMSVGAFVAFQSYIFLIQSPLVELGVMISEWQQGHASLGRIAKLLNEEQDPLLLQKGVALRSGSEVFAAHSLSYRYPGTSNMVLQDLSIELKAGERLGIHGSIGSGKSTLLRLLAGFEADFVGELKFQGLDIRRYNHKDLRDHIVMVPQRPFLFADTVRANLSLDRSFSDEDLWRALELSGLLEDIQALPQKLDTSLGEWGVNLSGGQKQRLTLARALVRRPRVLLLDDCLSAVDTLTEERILNALDREFQSSTVVWVAHRASTLRHCTRILELENGRFKGAQA